MKKCNKCDLDLAESEFYKASKGGLAPSCKECTKKAVRENYRKNIAHYKEYELSRSMLPHRVEARNKYQKTQDGRSASCKAKKKWIDSNPIKRLANITVGNAVRDGRIFKPDCCSECGKQGRIHGHHCDYAKVFDVTWLCPACHMRWHKLHGEGANAS